MRIVRSYQLYSPDEQNYTLIIGNFDAVHKGHQHILNEAKAIGKLHNANKITLLTFEPHPAVVIKKSDENIRILPLSEKIRHLQNAGVEILFLQRFSRNFATLSAADFFKEVLVDKLEVSHLVVGQNFRFGINKEGDTQTLKNLGKQYNIGITILDLLGTDNNNYSSSQIRDYLKKGEIESANKILGYNYYITGRVIKGESRGKSIGFPTANIALKNILSPLPGVYLVKVYIDAGSKTYYGVANIGGAPTFAKTASLLEVHIFDFNEQIYGKKVRVELLKYIRTQQKFNNINELILQIQKDVKFAKKILQTGTGT
jgi:riboflavin kinase/FMN adenylyltransferase